MGDFVTLTCPTCGAKLQITSDIHRFVCTHCGNEHLVKRSEGVIALQPLADSLTGLQRATDRAATELGLRRANEELAAIEARHSAARQTLANAQLALDQGRRRRTGFLAAAALGLCTIACCTTGTMIPMFSYYQTAAGETAVSDSMPPLMCIFTGLGLTLLVLAIISLTRASRLPQPGQSTSQASQAAAAAQADISATSVELQAKRDEIENLRRSAQPDAK